MIMLGILVSVLLIINPIHAYERCDHNQRLRINTNTEYNPQWKELIVRNEMTTFYRVPYNSGRIEWSCGEEINTFYTSDDDNRYHTKMKYVDVSLMYDNNRVYFLLNAYNPNKLVPRPGLPITLEHNVSEVEQALLNGSLPLPDTFSDGAQQRMADFLVYLQSIKVSRQRKKRVYFDAEKLGLNGTLLKEFAEADYSSEDKVLEYKGRRIYVPKKIVPTFNALTKFLKSFSAISILTIAVSALSSKLLKVGIQEEIGKGVVNVDTFVNKLLSLQVARNLKADKETLLKDLKASYKTEKCAITLTSLADVDPKDIIVTKCGHLFLESVFKTWFEKHKNCPMCRHKLYPNDCVFESYGGFNTFSETNAVQFNGVTQKYALAPMCNNEDFRRLSTVLEYLEFEITMGKLTLPNPQLGVDNWVHKMTSVSNNVFYSALCAAFILTGAAIIRLIVESIWNRRGLVTRITDAFFHSDGHSQFHCDATKNLTISTEYDGQQKKKETILENIYSLNKFVTQLDQTQKVEFTCGNRLVHIHPRFSKNDVINVNVVREGNRVHHLISKY